MTLTKLEIEKVKERAKRVAWLYDAGSAWGTSDAGFVIARLLDIIESYEKELDKSKG